MSKINYDELTGVVVTPPIVTPEYVSLNIELNTPPQQPGKKPSNQVFRELYFFRTNFDSDVWKDICTIYPNQTIGVTGSTAFLKTKSTKWKKQVTRVKNVLFNPTNNRYNHKELKGTIVGEIKKIGSGRLCTVALWKTRFQKDKKEGKYIDLSIWGKHVNLIDTLSPGDNIEVSGKLVQNKQKAFLVKPRIIRVL